MVIDGPNGSQRIANPLFSYSFKPLNSTELPSSPVSLASAVSRTKADLDTSVQCLGRHCQSPQHK